MHLISKLNIDHKKFFSLIALVPISFIAGKYDNKYKYYFNYFNIYTFFWKNFSKIEFFFLDKLLLAFFVLILITGIINNFQLLPVIQTWEPDFDFNQYFPTIIKSFYF